MLNPNILIIDDQPKYAYEFSQVLDMPMSAKLDLEVCFSFSNLLLWQSLIQPQHIEPAS